MQIDRKNTPQSDLPHDASLRGMSLLLDSGQVRARLQAHVNVPGAEITSCRVEHVRYKAATSCVAAYTLSIGAGEITTELVCYGKAFAAGSWPDALAKAKERAWSQPELLPPFMVAEDVHALFYVFPNDAELKGLKLFDEPKKLQRLLYEHYRRYPEAEYRISDRRLAGTVIRYKPEKRAVIEIKTRAVHRETGEKHAVCVYGRVYVDDRGRVLHNVLEQLRTHAQSEPGVELPVPIAYLPEKRALLLEHLEGVPMMVDLSEGDLVVAAGRAAAALGVLHGADSPAERTLGTEEAMAEASVAAEAVRTIAPELDGQVAEILARLNASIPDGDGPTGFVHGDFHHGQVLFRGDAAGIIDFDRAATGSQLTDVANFCANLRCLRIEGRIAASGDAERAFVESYQRARGAKINARELNFWLLLDLLLLAVRPFRTLQPAWRERVTATIGECAKVSL